MKKILRVICCAAISWIITGCETVPVKKPSEMMVSHGYIVGSIHSELSMGVVFKSKQGKEISVPAQGSVLLTKNIETWVPAGSYEITALINRSFVGNDVIQIPKDSFPKIEVKPGQLLDLNHLIPVNLGAGKFTVLAIPRKEPYVPRLVTENPSLFEGKPVVNWLVEGGLAESGMKMASSGQGLIIDLIIHHGRKKQQADGIDLLSQAATHQEAFDLIKPYRQPSTPLFIDSNGDSYFGTQTGQIRFKKQGVWDVIDTEYLDAILALEVKKNGDILVGFESGKLIESKDGGKTWSFKYQLPKNELFFGLKTFNNRLLIGAWIPDRNSGIYLNHPGQQITPVLKMYAAEGSSYQEVLQFTGKEVVGCCAKPIWIGVEKSVYIAMPPDQIQVYNVQSASAKVISPQKQFSGLWVANDESLMSSWLAMGMFSSAFYSDDQGATWVGLPKPPYQPRHIYLDNPQSGLMWSLAIGMNSTSYKLDTMDVKNKDWKEVTKSGIDCLQLLPNFVKEEYFCILDNGVIRTYTKGSWLD